MFKPTIVLFDREAIGKCMSVLHAAAAAAAAAASGCNITSFCAAQQTCRLSSMWCTLFCMCAVYLVSHSSRLYVAQLLQHTSWCGLLQHARCFFLLRSMLSAHNSACTAIYSCVLHKDPHCAQTCAWLACISKCMSMSMSYMHCHADPCSMQASAQGAPHNLLASTAARTGLQLHLCACALQLRTGCSLQAFL
jgi:hypothetical protein